MTGRRCVVTGAGGFIGHQLANALAADGWDVAGVDVRFPDDEGAPGPSQFVRVVGDFRDPATMRPVLAGASVLFHLAGAHLQVRLSDRDYWDLNVHSIQPLLRLAQDAGVSRYVHTSSTGVYGDVGAAAADEDTVPRPQSIYGETKLAGERAALEYGRRHGLEVVVLRPAWVYGPGCPRTARLCAALRRRRFLMIGAGRNLRHPVYIDDMIEAFRLAATVARAVGQTLVIAGDRAVTTRELVDAVCAAFDLPYPALRAPYPLGLLVAAGVETLFRLARREPPFSRRTLEFFGTNNSFDITRARSVLGYSPRHALLQGLAATRARLEHASAGQGRTSVRHRGIHLA